MAINTKSYYGSKRKGLSAIDAIENYNKKTTVRDIEAYVYDSFGNEIKKKKTLGPKRSWFSTLF
jgi:preprotein translocase subunit Sec63